MTLEEQIIELKKGLAIAINNLRGEGLDGLRSISATQGNQLADFLLDIHNGFPAEAAYERNK